MQKRLRLTNAYLFLTQFKLNMHEKHGPKWLWWQLKMSLVVSFHCIIKSDHHVVFLMALRILSTINYSQQHSEHIVFVNWFYNYGKKFRVLCKILGHMYTLFISSPRKKYVFEQCVLSYLFLHYFAVVRIVPNSNLQQWWLIYKSFHSLYAN